MSSLNLRNIILNFSIILYSQTVRLSAELEAGTEEQDCEIAEYVVSVFEELTA